MSSISARSLGIIDVPDLSPDLYKTAEATKLDLAPGSC